MLWYPDAARGERYEEDAGLQYLNARYYDPELGRFIQPDWFEVTAAGVGTNRYAYSFNDPVNSMDPGGNAVPIGIAVIYGVPAIIGLIAANEISDAQDGLNNQNGFLDQAIQSVVTMVDDDPSNQDEDADLSKGKRGASGGWTTPGDPNQEDPDDEGDEESEDERNWRQDKPLSKRDIARLKKSNENPHQIKKDIVGKKGAQLDLFKDKKGNIFVKPKGGDGPGEPTHLYINSF